MKLAALIGAVAVLSSCYSAEPFDPVHCDYEQAQVGGPVTPADRSAWVDYDGDGVVVVCMWTHEGTTS